LIKRKERQNTMDDLKMKVEIEIDRVYANKDKKER